MIHKKILALDGGGIKGVFAASFLSTIEETVGHSVGDYFDLIAGTSTGGILALALGTGLPPSRILSFYEDFGPAIFEANLFRRILRTPFLSRYNSTKLRECLGTVFGNKELGDSTKRLVIPCTNLENGEVYVFKTAHNPRLSVDYRTKMVDVALATGAAPTYFPVHRPASGIPFIDGGIWANNPTGISVVEAVSVLSWPPESLKVLSIGCPTAPLGIDWGRRLGLGLVYWGPRIANLFLTAQSSASLGVAQLIAGTDNVFRICPTVAEGRFGLDATNEIASLKGLGTSEARKAISQLRPAFFSERAAPFTPSV